MSLAYVISASGSHVQIVGTDKVTTNDCIRLVQRVRSDPLYRSDSTALIDLRQATYSPKDLREVIRIAMAVESLPYTVGNNIAIVAKRSTIFFAEILALHIRTATTVGIKVFSDLGAAMAYCRRRSRPHRRALLSALR